MVDTTPADRLADALVQLASRLGRRQEGTMNRVEANIDRGLWVPYGHPRDDYTAAAFRSDDVDGTCYVLTFHQGAMPAFQTRSFATLGALIAAMREVEPDLRKWRFAEGD